jgi:two-component system phosphate regulon sensor histidine kinase PhoR
MKKIKNIKVENQFEAVLSGINDGVIILDTHDNVVEYNVHALRLLKLNVLEKKKPFFDFIDEPEVKIPLERIIRSKKARIAINLEFRKHKYFLKIVVSDIINERNKNLGRLITIAKSPISKKFRRLREDFVANVSHELKTPLTVIKGAVETLLEGAIANPEDAEHFIQAIAKHTDRLSTLINDILSLSSTEQKVDRHEIAFEEFNVRDILEDEIALFKGTIDERQLELRLDCGNIKMKGNRQLIGQAVSNLIDNAIKYNKENGYIHIKAEEVDKTVLISIKDSGIGIHQANVPRLFERFYRVDKIKSRNIGGTGLGLSIVKQIVKAHNGLITVKSEPDKGSTFIIILPSGKEKPKH